jgi:thiamine-monophosphate kinase
MTGDERDFTRWLTRRLGGRRRHVELGVGDDMAVLTPLEGCILVTTDMLLDGVHFETGKHSPAAIGTKAMACSLSDCAAMAVRPVAAAVSVALPRDYGIDRARMLVEAMASTGEAYECDLIGGDTTCWNQPLAIDVAMLAVPYPGVKPVRRSGGRPGDTIFVTGPLGGSILHRHLTFTPRVREARAIAERLGADLHAMLDISDGLAIDLDRIAEASQVGAVLEESLVRQTAAQAAQEAAEQDGRSLLEHVLHDGEDFELLLTGSIDEQTAGELELRKVGTLVEGRGLRLRGADQVEHPLSPEGYEHF